MEILYKKTEENSFTIALKDESTAIFTILKNNLTVKSKDESELTSNETNKCEVYFFDELYQENSFGYLLNQIMRTIPNDKHEISVKITIFEEVNKNFIFSSLKIALEMFEILQKDKLKIMFEGKNEKIMFDNKILYESVKNFE